MSNIWKKYSVQEVIEGHFSGPSPTCEERQISSDEEWGLLKTTAVTWSGWDYTKHKVPPKSHWGNNRIEIRPGDVLITKAGPRHRVGVCVYVLSTPPQIMVSGKMIGLHPNENLTNCVVLSAALASESPQKFLDRRTTGMADSQLNFTNENLLQTPIILPPIEHQRKIAKIFTTVDNQIEKTKALIEKYQTVKQGMMHDLFTRGVDENGQLRPKQEDAPHLYKKSELGWIPKAWDVSCLGDKIIGRPHNGYSPNEVEQWQGVGILGLGCLTKNGFAPCHIKSAPANDHKVDMCILHDKDVLLSRANTLELVGMVGMFRELEYPCAYPDLMMRIKPAPQMLTASFLELILRSELGRRQIIKSAQGTSASMVKISGSRVINFQFAFPQVEEQISIVNKISALQDVATAYEKGLQKLQNIKTGLMQDLLTGKVPVTPDKEEAA